MSTTSVVLNMDEDLKIGMEQVCHEMGLSMSAAFTIFAARVKKDRRIPFDVSADPDPFYSEINMSRFRKAVADVESGRSKLTEHELIEAEDD